MTTPTTTQAELEAANEISKYFGYSVSDKVRARILEILAAHRAAPPADPAVAHAAELESTLRELTKRMDGTIGARYAENARALLATLDAERKVQVTL